MTGKVPAANFMETILANVDNKKLTDAEFREFVRTGLSLVERLNVRETGG